ncbi:MAG: hypothetical protein ACOC43_03285 [Desulfohalobiaceae bacterium]
MELPRHIQEAADEARKLQKQIAQDKQGSPDSQQAAAPESEESEADEQSHEESGEEQEEQAQHGEQQEGEQGQQAASEESEHQFDGHDQGRDEKGVDYWKQRFETLKGKYDAEVPRQAQEIRELRQQLQEHQKQVQQLQEQKQAQPQESDKDISPENYAEYGEEMQALAEKLSWAVQTLNELRQENAKLKEQVGTVYEQQDQQTYQQFLDQVRKQYPHFDQQDQDSEFLQWVEDMGIDLAKIGQQRDVKKAVEVYKSWNDLVGRYGQPNQETQPQEKSQRLKQGVNKQVSPPKSKPTPPGDGQKKSWTRQDIKRAYDDIKSGRLDEQQALKLKNQIFKAQREGRITD